MSQPGTVAPRPPSRRELEALAAYCGAGSVRRAAETLDVDEQTVKNALGRLYAALDVGGALEAATALGWLRVPDELNAQVTGSAAAITAHLRLIRASIDHYLDEHGAA